MKRCYYEVLDVDRKATAAEIKTSYRKMALKYHPDKNSEEGSKERFVEINEAYNVLSDVNERTWYDNNREKLLFNKEEMTKEDLEQFSFGFNIWHYFTTGCFKGYDDAEGGFYAVYRDVFEKIKAEEAKAFSLREDLTEELRKYEGFGDSATSEDRVLRFYEEWENFSTYKTFVWSEEWDTREASCRWARREMEKENKKQRQGERKTYVKTIKDLLAYVRKRDPRFISYLARCREEDEKKEQERLEREREKKKEKEEMKHVKQRLEEERFREIEEYYRKQNELSNTPPPAVHHKPAPRGKPEEEERESEFYCEICEKEFKSENQLRNHEKSKQHKQMVKDIEKEVLLKEEILQKAAQADQDEETQSEQHTKEEEPSPSKKKRNKKKKNQQQQQKQEQSSDNEETKEEPKREAKEQPKQQGKQEAKQEAKPDRKAETKAQPKEESSSDDQDHFMNTLLNNRNKKNQVKPAAQQAQPAGKAEKKKPAAKEESGSEGGEGEGEGRVGKAKLKKQKRAEQEKAGKAGELKCKGCSEAFPSKTKLFEHINKTGHAAAK